MRTAMLAAVVAWTTATSAIAAPEVLTDGRAQAHFDRAQRHFDQEQYAAAIPELKAAYAIEPNPMLLYAWAQAERLAGSCPRAMELYRRFLDTGPDPAQAQLAETNILDCEAELPATEDGGSDSAPPPPADAPEDDAPPGPWIADPAGATLTGLGVAATITGGVLMGVARQKARAAPNADIEGDYLQARQEATKLNTVGVTVLSIGAALVVSGAIRYALVARKRRRSQTEPEPPPPSARRIPRLGIAGLGVGLRF